VMAVQPGHRGMGRGEPGAGGQGHNELGAWLPGPTHAEREEGVRGKEQGAATG
jgi:hypothetical protein